MKDTGHTNTPGRRARWLAVAIAGVAALTMSDCTGAAAGRCGTSAGRTGAAGAACSDRMQGWC